MQHPSDEERLNDPVSTLEVDRRDFRTTRVVAASPTPLEPGQIRLATERFALTANNISYAVAGDLLGYWGFFPAEAPWGRIPVMGLSSVAESAHPDIPTGGRYFGFTPIAHEVVIRAEPRRNGFRDVGAHRADHAVFYTDFRDVTTDAMFRPAQADEYLLLWALFTTAFLADHHLAGRGFLGARQTVITSASSKTSISLAACLARRPDQRSVGLTSERNRAFVEGLGVYDQVITYDEVAGLDPSVPSVLVDMAGSGPVRTAVHTHFADRLAISLAVGATHWEHGGGGQPLPGPRPEFFFAPAALAQRSGEPAADDLATRLTGAFHEFLDGASRWLTVEHHSGIGEVEAVYRALLDGRVDPSVGHVLAMRRGVLS